MTAPTIMQPLTICCQKADTFIKSRVLFNTPIISAPTIVPATVPIPPAEREVPPITRGHNAKNFEANPNPGLPQPDAGQTHQPRQSSQERGIHVDNHLVPGC